MAMQFIFPYTPLIDEPIADDMIFAFGQRRPLDVTGLRLLHLGLWRGRVHTLRSLPSLLDGLAEFYRQNERENTICVAPDLALRHKATMRAWEIWHEDASRPSVVPVIQPGSKFSESLFHILKQVDYYERWHEERGTRMTMVCLGNSLIRAREVDRLMPVLVEAIRARGVECVHVMGAGWDIQDILNWADLGVDSIDSTSYYTDAEAGKRWFWVGTSCIYDSEHSAGELVRHNAACIQIALANRGGLAAKSDLRTEWLLVGRNDVRGGGKPLIDPT